MRVLTSFVEGQKVWIERTKYVESVEMIRNPQVIEKIMLVPVTVDGENVYVQQIDIVGSKYLYTGEDFRPYREGE